jgi:phosphate transport system protein
MERQLDEGLKFLKEQVLHMGSLVEEMIQLAVSQLEEKKPGLAEEVKKREQEVNLLQMDVDDHCLKILALYQPAAADLRFVTAAMKIVSDLERIGDQAVNISKTSLIFLDLPEMRQKLSNIPKMAELAMSMLKESLNAFVNRDEKIAMTVLKQDDEEDKMKTQAFNRLMEHMKKDPTSIQQCLDLILIARNLEKIGDHATNIAEDVIFMVLGQDIRHQKSGPNK